MYATLTLPAGTAITSPQRTPTVRVRSAVDLRNALLQAALDHGGSFPIRDLGDATRRQLESCYPMVGAFLADKRRCDPAERLQNGWYRALVATMRGEHCAVRWGQSS